MDRIFSEGIDSPLKCKSSKIYLFSFCISETHNLNISDFFNHIFNYASEIWKYYPDTILLLLTLLPIYKIYDKLKNIMVDKNSITENDKNISSCNFKKGVKFTVCFWVIIITIIIFIFPEEIWTERRGYSIFSSFDLTHNDYKLIKIGISIVANALALSLCLRSGDFKGLNIISALFGLFWTCLLLVDNVVYPGCIEIGTTYFFESLGLLYFVQSLLAFNNISVRTTSIVASVADAKTSGDTARLDKHYKIVNHWS